MKSLKLAILLLGACLGASLSWSQEWTKHEADMVNVFGSQQAYARFAKFADSPLYKSNFKDVGQFGLFTGWRSPTRFEIATFVYESIDHGRQVACMESMNGTMTQQTIVDLLESAPIQHQLVQTFARELGQMGVDINDLQSKVHLLTVYADMLTLELAGHSVRLLVGDRGMRPADSWDMAVSTHYAYSKIMIGFHEGKFDAAAKARELRCVAPLARLFHEFSKEMIAFGVDMPSVMANLNAFSELKDGSLSLRSSRSGPPTKVLDPDGSDAWVCKSIAGLQDEDDLIAYPFDDSYRPTNYEVAASIEPTISYMSSYVPPNPTNYDMHSMEVGMLSTEYGIKMQSMRKLIDKFAPELKALGVNVDQLRHRIHAAKSQVEDLWGPQNVNAWASS